MASQNPHGTHTSRMTREGEHNGEAASLREELRERGSDILRDTIEEFRDRSDDVKTVVTEYVKEKPFKAMSIAVVTGMALALLLKR